MLAQHWSAAQICWFGSGLDQMCKQNAALPKHIKLTSGDCRPQQDALPPVLNMHEAQQQAAISDAAMFEFLVQVRRADIPNAGTMVMCSRGTH